MSIDPYAKYLRSRACGSPWQISGTQRKDFRAAVIIPALAERSALPDCLAALANNPADLLQQTLLLVVINNRTDVPAEQREENRQTLNWLQSTPWPQLNLVWVDASSAGLELPQGQGVGLARKIGFDLALGCLDWNRSPLLISLDADSLVDEHYLSAISRHFVSTGQTAATLPFYHQAANNPHQEQAIRRYELYLRSYLFGLQQAGSPYAYHSIGSAFACRAAAYIKAGGMNRRQAAEDFYFLQQLAKTGGVEMLRGTVVRPSPRFSARVPFGTGKAVQGQVDASEMTFSFTSAAAFAVLRAWLRIIEENMDASAESVLQQAGDLSPVLGLFLTELNFLASWERLQGNHRSRQQLLAAIHVWFDGLRTRQLLTRLDAGSCGYEVSQRVGQLLEWGGYPAVAVEGQQLPLLERLQNVEK